MPRSDESVGVQCSAFEFFETQLYKNRNYVGLSWLLMLVGLHAIAHLALLIATDVRVIRESLDASESKK